jgi:chromate reductase
MLETYGGQSREEKRMAHRRKILAISGSTRASSSNLKLIEAIGELYASELDVRILHDISDIPHFNPDLDTDNPPAAISDFRRQLNDADGVLICTPEYAMGVPGMLKNAIDWTVSSMEFSHKPVALITASSSGHKGHQSLLGTLRVIEADIPDDSHLLISFVKAKVKDNTIDPGTLVEVKRVVDSMRKRIDERRDQTTQSDPVLHDALQKRPEPPMTAD